MKGALKWLWSVLGLIAAAVVGFVLFRKATSSLTPSDIETLENLADTHLTQIEQHAKNRLEAERAQAQKTVQQADNDLRRSVDDSRSDDPTDWLRHPDKRES